MSKKTAISEELAKRVETSRIIGADKSLVLHGGGNTSVKLAEEDIFGQQREVLYVKGSGWDLETIEPQGFAPVWLEPLRRLAMLDGMTDTEMVNQLVTNLVNANAPVPSIETILHAILPYKYVDHTHADAILAITNTPRGRELIEELYGDDVVIIPYVMPGFDLAKLVAKEFPLRRTERTIGMVLLNHGIFSFGETAEESLQRMVDLVRRAQKFLRDRCGAWACVGATWEPTILDSVDVVKLRRSISLSAGGAVIMTRQDDTGVRSFLQRPDLHQIVTQGPVTPDHVIRTKRVPMVGTDVEKYTENYRRYFSEHVDSARDPKTMLDPAPRVVLDRRLGFWSIGRSARDAAIVSEIYRHTIDVIQQAEAIGGYQALPSEDIFDVEYWELEQAKLKKNSSSLPFAGEVALVTGAASGIGAATVAALRKLGAAVIGVDVNPVVEQVATGPDYLGICGNLTDQRAVSAAIERGIERFGGLDMLIMNAGVFPKGKPIDLLPLSDWCAVMDVNLDAAFDLMNKACPFLALAPRGGRVVVVGSKNVPAPGPGAAAYSASKAALTQLARVAALEWGKLGIRVNVVHPNAVFDTGIWTDEIIEARAQEYGLSVDAYKKRNLLQVEVTSNDVARLIAEMCSSTFWKVTGAQIPIDGGNDRVI